MNALQAAVVTHTGLSTYSFHSKTNKGPSQFNLPLPSKPDKEVVNPGLIPLLEALIW
jgi:hypothetical protein